MVAVLPCVEQTAVLFKSPAESPRRWSRTAVRVATEGPVPSVKRIIDRDLKRCRMRMCGPASCECRDTCADGQETKKHPSGYTSRGVVLSRCYRQSVDALVWASVRECHPNPWGRGLSARRSAPKTDVCSGPIAHGRATPQRRGGW